MSNLEVKQIDKLATENHKLFKVIDKCTNKNDTVCNGCMSKCPERVQIDSNIQQIYRLMKIN